MDFIDCVNSRRSIRKYQNKDVPIKSIEIILKMAMQAPSAFDERPWHFIVVSDDGRIKRLTELDPVFLTAKAAILVCGEPKKEKIANSGFWIQDCAVCCQNIHLAVCNEGLATVWLAVHGVENRVNYCLNEFKIPRGIIPFAIFPIGYPAENLGLDDRFDNELIHRDEW